MKLRFMPMDFKLSSKKTDLVDCAAEVMNLIYPTLEQRATREETITDEIGADKLIPSGRGLNKLRLRLYAGVNLSRVTNCCERVHTALGESSAERPTFKRKSAFHS